MAQTTQEKEFIRYIEDHPEYYPVTQADIYLKILKNLKKAAKTLDELNSGFPVISREDLELIILSLVRLRLLDRLKTATKLMYYVTEEGKGLIAEVDKIKSALKVG